MKHATYDELLEEGLICSDTPHATVHSFMNELHTTPSPIIPVTIIVRGGVVQEILTPHPDKITVWLIDYDEDPDGQAIEYPTQQEPPQ